MIKFHMTPSGAREMCRRRGSVTAGESADEVLEVVVRPAGMLELCDDADGQRVAADTGEVFAEQVSCSPGIPRGGGANDLDVVAFPVHLMAAGIFAGRAGDGVEIGNRQPEGRVGVDCEAQGCRRLTCVDGSLRLAVEPGRLPVCGYNTAVVLDRRPVIGRRVAVAAGLVRRWVHHRQIACVA
jgi:hypothetical protein